jgi:chromate transporter
MLDLILWFALLSLLSVGGISSIIPEMHRVVVEQNGWVSAAEFTELFAVSQAAPGPNVLIASLVGWKVAGPAGALLALAAICAPAAALAWWVQGLWERFRDAPWRATVQRALLPVAVGLILAGGYVLATPQGLGWKNALIAGAAAAGMLATKLNPLWLLAGGGVLGALLL